MYLWPVLQISIRYHLELHPNAVSTNLIVVARIFIPFREARRAMKYKDGIFPPHLLHLYAQITYLYPRQMYWLTHVLFCSTEILTSYHFH